MIISGVVVTMATEKTLEDVDMLHEMVVLWIQNHQEEWEKINKNGAVFTGEAELIAEFRKLCEECCYRKWGSYLIHTSVIMKRNLGSEKKMDWLTGLYKKHNGRKVAGANDGRLHVNTPFGVLMAYSKGEPDNPGICIDLCRAGAAVDAPLVLTEYTATEGEVEEGSTSSPVYGDR